MERSTNYYEGGVSMSKMSRLVLDIQESISYETNDTMKEIADFHGVTVSIVEGMADQIRQLEVEEFC